jgi:hypothetical protein
MKTLLLPAALGLGLLGLSCATHDTSVRGGYALAITGAVFDDTTTSVSGVDADTELSDIGLRVEAFTSPEASFYAGLNFREYDFEGPGSADGNELHVGGRYYLMPDQPLQPFFQGGFFYGDGLSFTGGLDSDGYAGLAVGGGATYFLAQSALVEAGLRYDKTLMHPETTILGTDVEWEIDGWSAWLGLGISF